jgi:hypothetical protein
LSPAQRAALLAEVGESNGDERSSSAVKMLRMRARKRLRAITKDSPGFASLELLIQRLLGNADSAPGISASVAACAPVAAGLLAITLFGAPSRVEAAEVPKRSPRAATATPEALVQRGFLTIAGYELPIGHGGDSLSTVRLDRVERGLPLPGAPEVDVPAPVDEGEDKSRHNRKKHGGYDGDGDDLPTDLGIDVPPTPDPGPPDFKVEKSDTSAGAHGVDVDYQVTVGAAGKSATVKAAAQSHDEPTDTEPGAVAPKVEVAAELDDASVTVELGD